jgi:hypothetical protein
VLPHAQDHPIAKAQRPFDESVAFHVGVYFLLPESSVLFGQSPVNGTPMPEAAIDENCDALRSKHKVRPSENRLIPSPPRHSQGSKKAGESDLGAFVAARWDRRHHGRSLLLREYVRHGLQTVTVFTDS